MQRINISFPDDLARDFRRYIPVRKRSSFIAGVVREKLPKKNPKKEWIKSLEAQEKIIKEIREDFKYSDAEVWERLP